MKRVRVWGKIRQVGMFHIYFRHWPKSETCQNCGTWLLLAPRGETTQEDLRFGVVLPVVTSGSTCTVGSALFYAFIHHL